MGRASLLEEAVALVPCLCLDPSLTLPTHGLGGCADICLRCPLKEALWGRGPILRPLPSQGSLTRALPGAAARPDTVPSNAPSPFSRPLFSIFLYFLKGNTMEESNPASAEKKHHSSP